MFKTDNIGKNNTRAAIAIGALGGIGGSILTILLVFSAVWAAIRLIAGHFPYRMKRTDLLVLVPPGIFAIVQITFGVLNAKDGTVFSNSFFEIAGPLAIYLSGWLIIPRFRAATFDSIDALALGAGFCSILAIPVGLYQVLEMEIRAEGGAGNALPFAMICTIFGSIALLNLRSTDIWRYRLGWAGFAASIVCVMMSGTLSLLPVLFFWFGIFVLSNRSLFKVLFHIRSLYILGAAILVTAYPFMLWLRRFSSLIEYIRDPSTGVHFPQFTERLAMWTSAVTLFFDRPWLGHGLQNRKELIASTTGLEHTHFHNGFLTVMVDSGIIGLFAALVMVFSPMVLGFQSSHDNRRFDRVFLGSVISISFIVSGLTNFLFMHDIYDSLFLWTGFCLAASFPVPGALSETGNENRI